MTVVPLRQESTKPMEGALMRLQRVQHAHDEAAHRDILSFSLHKRLKHMVLHFFKYAGNIEAARVDQDAAGLRRVLIDTFIICLASANALNLSLDRAIGVCQDLQEIAGRDVSQVDQDVYGEAVSRLVLVGGQMAKAVESLDHMEDGNPRAAMSALLPQLTGAVLGMLARAGVNDIEATVRARLLAVERRALFAPPNP